MARKVKTPRAIGIIMTGLKVGDGSGPRGGQSSRAMTSLTRRHATGSLQGSGRDGMAGANAGLLERLTLVSLKNPVFLLKNTHFGI